MFLLQTGLADKHIDIIFTNVIMDIFKYSAVSPVAKARPASGFSILVKTK
ncbi:MAG: hypothetical protein IPO37_10575 [Saprospiraceae bacterium]|nr:hypothetical protein [Saprospiraceae bacterium]